jgi:hypothetical protein
MDFTACAQSNLSQVLDANELTIGPIVIHGPSSANYDIDLGPWLLSDWYHEDVFSLEWVGVTTFLAALPETSILNGKGVFECNPANDSKKIPYRMNPKQMPCTRRVSYG